MIVCMMQFRSGIVEPVVASSRFRSGAHQLPNSDVSTHGPNDFAMIINFLFGSVHFITFGVFDLPAVCALAH